jgi:hypothetical protein
MRKLHCLGASLAVAAVLALLIASGSRPAWFNLVHALG